jgi:hypothetical protein
MAKQTSKAKEGIEDPKEVDKREELRNDPCEKYIREFVFEKGNGQHNEHYYRDIARQIGILPATMQQVIEMRNRAGRPTIAALFKHFEDFDLVRAMTGESGSIRNVNKTEEPTPVSAKMHKMEIENEKLKVKVEHLVAENKKVWRLALPNVLESELNFLKASSHTTASDHMPISRRSIGFHNADNDETLDDILNEVKIIALDSSDCKVIQLNSEEGKQTA